MDVVGMHYVMSKPILRDLENKNGKTGRNVYV